MMHNRINFDHYSGAPVLPEVRQAMAQALEAMGNASSIHQAGRKAKMALGLSRRQVAALINAAPDEIHFTSCGTESNNWAIRGLIGGNRRKGNGLIISAIEHPSIALVARRLEVDNGVRTAVLPVDSEGCVSTAALKEMITPQTVLVSIMLANGEVGTLELVKELTATAHERGALFHTDAIAAAGNMPVDVRALGIDALSLSGNMFGAAQGCAALYVREGVRILPLMEGGGQEHGARSGTENVPAIVGMGIAAQRVREQMHERVAHASRLRGRLKDGLQNLVDGIRFNGPSERRLPNNLHACIEGVSGESIVLGLDEAGIAVGLGSACNAKSMRPSPVLKAMGLTDEQAKGAFVFSLGADNTDADIDRALEVFPQVVKKVRSVTALTLRN